MVSWTRTSDLTHFSQRLCQLRYSSNDSKPTHDDLTIVYEYCYNAIGYDDIW